jgi:hypothetical protein
VRKRIIAAALALGLFCGVELHAATVNVVNTKDNLVGSLRQAIQDADPGDTINFTVPTTDAGYDPAAA